MRSAVSYLGWPLFISLCGSSALILAGSVGLAWHLVLAKRSRDREAQIRAAKPPQGVSSISGYIARQEALEAHEYSGFDLDADTPESVQHFAKKWREANGGAA